jgi:hypothetical protein
VNRTWPDDREQAIVPMVDDVLDGPSTLDNGAERGIRQGELPLHDVGSHQRAKRVNA